MVVLEKPIAKRKPAFEVPAWLKQLVAQRLVQLRDLAQSKLNVAVPMPTLSFDLSGTTAGAAYLLKNHIQLNGQLLVENQQHVIAVTLPHELAHLLTHKLYPRASAHGTEWRHIMGGVLGVPPSRTHSLDTSRTRTGPSYIYACKCAQPHVFSARRHKSGRKFACRTCGAALRYSHRQEETPAWKKPTSSQAALYVRLAEQAGRPVSQQALSDRALCSEEIRKLQNLSPPAPSVAPPAPALPTAQAKPPSTGFRVPATDRQQAFARVLSKRKGVPLPPGLFDDKHAASAWISRMLA